jgi:8-oxo-dGTP diphosphatase
MLRVTCAIIRNEENEILVVQRGDKTDHPFKWEFPGGKMKESETEEECIVREIMEELSVSIVICKRMEEVEYDYTTKQIVLIPFICDTIEDLPLLTEHIGYKWLGPAELRGVDFLEADIIVAENYLRETGIAIEKNSYGQDSVHEAFDEEALRSMIANNMGTKAAEWLATSAVDNPAIFKKLIEYSFSDDKKLAFRASWSLTKICDNFPEIIYPYLPRIIESLDKLDNESTQRSFLRSISLSDMNTVSNKHHGMLAEHCFNMLRSGFSAIAIKAYSMDILYKLALIYPEITNELTATINMLQGEGSAGIRAKGRIVLDQLTRRTKGHGSSRL